MSWRRTYAPTADEFEALAQLGLEALPEAFRARLDGLTFRIEDVAPPDVLAEFGIENPYELTGLYQGVDLTQKSYGDPGGELDYVFLYRLPILDEWVQRGDIALGDLITHVLVHEIGHHFGLSDEEMHAIEASAAAAKP